MANLRITRIRTSANNSIRVEFSEALDKRINTSNIDVQPILGSIPKPNVLKVFVSNDLLYITTNYLTPYVTYKVTFKSTESQRFKSASGTIFLLEDGKNNVANIKGKSLPSTSIKDALTSYLDNNIYNLNDENNVSLLINSQDEVLSRGLQDIGQAANDNYLEHTVVDEKHIRGKGPWDRLNQEGAFEIVRVGLSETDILKELSFSFNSFPRDRVTLQKTDVNQEVLVIGDGVGTFNNLILTVDNSPVTKLKSVDILYQDGTTVEYDISIYGYQILDSIYDTSFASTLFTLKDNQFKLNSDAFDSVLEPISSGDKVVISYEYKFLGRNIDDESVVISEVIPSIREVTPPIVTEFSLDHAPVVTELDNIPTLGGVQFLNPRACIPFSEVHPAFIKEIPYRLESLPSAVGEYSIDYENGRVFVYGESDNDGTGVFPPVATYKYRKVFVNNLDYTYNSDLKEVVANPLRNLIGRNAKISFNYERVLVPNIDYKGNVHVEELNERVNNNLSSLTSLTTNNYPITNVFRVYNETTGEIYPVNRFSDTTIYFSANQYPKIIDVERERAAFSNVTNETLIIDSETINVYGVRVFKILLSYQNIIAATEDLIGSSFNSSVTFSRNDLFVNEYYYDKQTSTVNQNINKLSVGDYVVDYNDGIVYVGVLNNQDLDVGTINYKKPKIKTSKKHIISVSELYFSLNPNSGINITLNYSDFTDEEISPNVFYRSDERFLNNDSKLPYYFNNGYIEVSDDIKVVRGIYDLYNLNNNNSPINFGIGSSINGNVITVNVDGQNIQEDNVVIAGGKIQIPFISDGVFILKVNSVLRKSDGVELWDNFGQIDNYTLTLSGTGTPIVGDEVVVNYQVQLNGGSTPVVDYNHGDYFVNYSYLADEILVSYEWGDNVIDFRESTSLDEGTEYYVTYKVGALRDALLANFGTMVDLPIMQSFDTSLPRENYRDALQGALQSFPKGPTVTAIKELVKSITKVEPELTESIFDIWTLGTSSLYQNNIDYTGDPQLVIGKFDYGVLIDTIGQTISFPTSSNLRLEEGTIEMFVNPNWDGLDNDATLMFDQLKIDGYIISADDIYIGSNSYHPIINSDGYFTVSRFDSRDPSGLPSAIFLQNRGYFIYYDEEEKRWNFLAKDNTYGHEYSGKVFTSGEFYDVKFIQDLGEPNDVLRSLTNEITFKWTLDGYDGYDGYTTGDGYIEGATFDGITFMSDNSHYLFDTANMNNEVVLNQRKSQNRMSLYKDGKGYLSFEVFDKNNSLYKVSADISDWRSGQEHFVSTSWKLNSFDNKDEIHLFIDGVEVPNILRFGGRPIAATGDRFRTVKPEIVVGTISKKIIKGEDLNTVINQNIIYSPTVNFQNEGIVIGDTIDIFEIGFGSFTITNVNQNYLTINGLAFATLNDGKYSINKFSSVVSDEVDLSSNVAISILSAGVETEIPGPRADFPSYSISKNLQLQTVLTLFGPANVGDQILIRTLGLNHRRCRDNVFLWGDTQSVLKTMLPPPINLDEVKVISNILPLYVVGPSNSTIVSGNFVSNTITTKVSNQVEGRRLSVRVTGGNVDFTTPVTVKITGTSTGGVTETLSFTEATKQSTINKWQTITDVEIIAKPIIVTSNSISVEILELFSVTYADGNNDFPIIRYSFHENSGNNLEGDVNGIVSGGYFIDKDVGKKIVIESPISVAGTYTISDYYSDGSIKVSPSPSSSFVNGKYKVFNTTIGRSGFQNGFFTFEKAGEVGTAYPLPQGRYNFDYSTWLEIPIINVEDHKSFIGSDFLGENQAKAIIDEFRILSKQLTDVRVGESVGVNEKTITTDFTTLKPFITDQDTLVLMHFDNLPFINDANFYKLSSRDFLQSSTSVNDNFAQSLVINERPFVVENNGYLSTQSEGTIEFWISPSFDTFNDPVERYYFDAASFVHEDVTSLTSNSVKISGRASEIISVNLQTDSNGKNYFESGSLENDFQTLYLKESLPSPQTPVRVTYIPNGFNGDRISIYKDSVGYINFRVNANGSEFVVRQPIFWQRDTWHRVFVSYKFNRRDNQDEMRLFVDGRESGTIKFGQGLLFGQGFVFGQGVEGAEESKLIANIDFRDVINKFYIGSTFRSVNLASAKFDNFKISNTARSPLICSGVPVDENFQTNLDIVKPVVEDLYTLYLINFNQLITENDDFTTLRDKKNGIFNFIIDVIDSFNIVSSNAKIEQIMEELINALKPAQSKVTINVIK